jgi:hypothetical protein
MARLIRPGVGFLAYTLDVEQVTELLQFLDQALALSGKSAPDPLDRERNLVKYIQDLKRESLPKGYAHHLL